MWFPASSGVLPTVSYLFFSLSCYGLEPAFFTSPTKINLLPDQRIIGLECADDIGLLGDSCSVLHKFLNVSDNSAKAFEVRFLPSKCKIVLQSWIGPTPNLFINEGSVEVVDIPASIFWKR